MKALGRYFIIDTKQGIIEHHIDLEKVARRMKLLEQWETLDSD